MKSKAQTKIQGNVVKQTRSIQAAGKASKQVKATQESRPWETSGVVPMATIISKPPPPPSQLLHPRQRPQPATGCSVIKLGLDVDLDQITVAIQYDHSAIKPAAAFSVEKLLEWVGQRVKEGHVVWTVYEACGFGFRFHRQLVVAGANSLVTAPVTLDTQRRLKNDGLDARALCTRLTRYVDGQKTELAVIRVPSVEEQQRRETGRQRDFWKREVQRLASHGRALRLEHEHQTLRGHWWGKGWDKVSKELSGFVRELLRPVREQLMRCQLQVELLTGELEARVDSRNLPKGLGALTMALFEAEICDVKRFSNRKQVGSYTGCCPSQYTSRRVERFGSIDRHGNKRLRAILVEAVWRLLRYQTLWHAYKKLAVRLTAGKALRKKAVIALSRQLAIDLWRVCTGRATWGELGLFPK